MAAPRKKAKIAERVDQFSDTTCWLVDLDSVVREPITQGATKLLRRCMRVYGWSETDGRKILKAYRQFLHIKKVKKDWDATLLSPSAKVDQMWHQQILDVVDYNHDCMLLYSGPLAPRQTLIWRLQAMLQDRTI